MSKSKLQTLEVIFEIIKGPGKGRILKFEKPSNFLIGRSKAAEVSLSETDRFVSRKQCVLEVVPPRCVLHHISKSNQTLLNDKPIEEAELVNNDVITVGFTSLKINIKSELKTKIAHCGNCNCEIEIPENADSKILCDDCSSGISNKKLIKSKLECNCVVCKKDLSAIIDAAYLTTGVEHICQDCLPEREYLKGDRIGKYDLIKFLNKGGMGAVYLVYHKDAARMLVLKKIDGIAKNELVIKHFLREINIHKGLSHKNIIRYVDSGQENNFPYLIMEYANSSDLEELLESLKGKVAFKDNVDYLLQSLEGLKYLHTRGIIHRDIKPGNILLHNHNKKRIIKLTDFGLAKPYKNAAGTILTKVGEKKGSLLYMSPEQILNTKDIDHRSDIYSLGVTFYYLMSTRLPYKYPSNFERNQILNKYGDKRERCYQELVKLGLKNNVINLVLSTKPIPIEEQIPGIDRNIADVINKMIHHDIDKRYQNVNDILTDLTINL